MQEERLVPKATRDTKNYYATVDPLSVVDHSLLHFVTQRCWHRVLDLGCGAGGYSVLLRRQGFDTLALDVNEDYVRIARELGVEANVFDGENIPLPNNSVDSVMMIEVLEHISDPANLLREVARVARNGLIASVPNCTQKFDPAPVVYEHMLDVDHKQFFTLESLTALLRKNFAQVEVREIVPVNALIAQTILPPPLRIAYRAAAKLGLMKPTHYFRLLATAEAPHWNDTTIGSNKRTR